MASADEIGSRLARRWVTGPDPRAWGAISGTGVLADLSGFTRLTEQLAGIGSEGAEVLHRALTLCFRTLLAPAIELGGDILGFAGDAALVWFDGPEHELRATAAATGMPRRLADLPAAVTGGRRLRLSVGVHTTDVLAVLVGHRQQALLFTGPGMSRLVALQGAAAPGQVLLDGATAARVPATWTQPGPEVDGLATAVPRRRRPGAIATATGTAEEPPGPWTLVDPRLRPESGGGTPPSEHRVVSIGFVSVRGLDGRLAAAGPDILASDLRAVAATVEHVAEVHGLTWLDVDVGQDAVKFLLAAGAPTSTGDDDRRLVHGLRQLVDTSPVPVRAGAQRGRVFAGVLGVEGRRRYTVLGDPTNTAARALGFAEDGHLVIADGFGAAEHLGVRTTDLGAVHVKNRTRAVQLRRVDPGPVTPDAVDAPTVDPHVLDVRSGPHTVLRQAWSAARRSQGGCIAVVEEPGMGGAAILVDLAAEASGQGAVVTHLAADPFLGEARMATVRMLAASVVAAIGAGAPPPPPVDADTDASVFAAALADWLDAVVRVPWLLVVEDLETVDDPSAVVLRRLVGRAAERPWLVVTAGRDPDRAVLPGVLTTTVRIDPLDDAAATRLVERVDPTLLPDRVVRIVAAAKGNPTVLAELARAARTGDDALPDSLERLAMRRIDTLPPDVRHPVLDASVFGRSALLADLAEVLAQPELADPAAWGAAAGVVQLDRSGDRLAFVHDAYRLAAYGSLTHERRRRLHGLIADHLLAGADVDDAVVAVHLERAGRRREAFPHARRAAVVAARESSLVDARLLLDQALRLAEEVDRRELGPLLLEQLAVLRELGDYAAVERTATVAGRLLTDPVDQALVCNARADVALFRNQARSVRTWVRRGLALVEADPSDRAAAARIRLQLAEAASHLDAGRHERCAALAGTALPEAERLGDLRLIGLAHQHLELAYSVAHDRRAAAHAEAAIEAFSAAGQHRVLVTTLVNAGVTALLEGRWSDARRYDTWAVDLARRLGSFHAVAAAEVTFGLLHLEQGHLGAARDLGERARRTYEVLGLDHHVAYCDHLLARVTAHAGDPDAEKTMAEARAAFVRAQDRAMTTECDIAMVELHLLAGRPEEARVLARSLERDVGAVEVPTQLAFGRLQGCADAACGDLTSAAERLGRTLDRARSTGTLHEIQRCLAALVAVEASGGPAAPPGAHDEARELAATLEMVTTRR